MFCKVFFMKAATGKQQRLSHVDVGFIPGVRWRTSLRQPWRGFEMLCKLKAAIEWGLTRNSPRASALLQALCRIDVPGPRTQASTFVFD